MNSGVREIIFIIIAKIPQRRALRVRVPVGGVKRHAFGDVALRNRRHRAAFGDLTKRPDLQLVRVPHHFRVQFKKRFAPVERCLFGGDNFSRIDSRIEPHHRIADQVKPVFRQTPVRAVRSAFHVR